MQGKLLLIKMIPLLKDKMGNKGKSNNYRSISPRPIILKVVELINIDLFGDILFLWSQPVRISEGYRHDYVSLVTT